MSQYSLFIIVLLNLLSLDTIAQKQLQITYENLTFGFRNIKSSKVKVISTQEACLSITEDLWHELEAVWQGKHLSFKYGNDYKVNTHYHFKDYLNNTLFYRYKKLFKCYIKEEQNQFNWEISDDRKKILGYTCTKAITRYRGRDYLAWFTTELPFKAAPWKYHGLPGVILEVKSLDDFTFMRAMSIKIVDGEKPKNPFVKKKFISWEEFVELYKEKLVVDYERLKANNARKGISYVGSNRPRIEIILPFNRLTSKRKEQWLEQLKGDNSTQE